MGIGRTNSGGGVSVSGVTATAVDVHPDKYFIDSSGVLTQGTMPLLAGATYNTSTSNRTIAAGQYISEDQTIRAVTTSNITDTNIKRGVTVKVGDSASAGRIITVDGALDWCNVATGTFFGNGTYSQQITTPAGFQTSSTILSYCVLPPQGSEQITPSTSSSGSVVMMAGTGKSSSNGLCIYSKNYNFYKAPCSISVATSSGNVRVSFIAPSDAVFSNMSYTYQIIWR